MSFGYVKVKKLLLDNILTAKMSWTSSIARRLRQRDA
jgi:hypothetical protein